MFSEWLQREINQRGWSQSDLARKAGIKRQVVNRYINQERLTPDKEILIAIARALDYPPEVVLRAAGILPTLPDWRSAAEEILGYKLTELSNSQIEELLQYVEFIQNRDERNLDRRTSYKKREGETPPETVKK